MRELPRGPCLKKVLWPVSDPATSSRTTPCWTPNDVQDREHIPRLRASRRYYFGLRRTSPATTTVRSAVAGGLYALRPSRAASRPPRATDDERQHHPKRMVLMQAQRGARLTSLGRQTKGWIELKSGHETVGCCQSRQSRRARARTRSLATGELKELAAKLTQEEQRRRGC